MSNIFSVIIPVYNKENYVNRSIQSVLNQSFIDFELIIIEDASTDDSLEIIKSFDDDRIRIYRRKRPGPGGYAARNLGISKSNGEWVCFLDADDYWSENHLSSAHELIKKYPKVDIISFGHNEIKKGNTVVHRFPKERFLKSSEAISLFSKSEIINTNSIVVKKPLLNKTEGFPAGKYKMGGDADLWLRLLLIAEGILVSPKITSTYQKDHAGIISNPKNREEQHPVLITVNEVLNTKERDDISKPLKKLANRKSLNWSLDRKETHSFKFIEFKNYYFTVFSVRDYLKLLILILPNFVYKIYRSFNR